LLLWQRQLAQKTRFGGFFIKNKETTKRKEIEIEK
jgi:hypothetical protein